ncbi:hypothetical protein SLEP1_g59803 [Rubroshorea leprosula]|uniref:Uncharacterized protein n=1 Tax=Rubroshorea leprosula TaxID=152421 RepID=A0AAV5MUY4_9ROSI|nr:hypothetical protein SLEP1_g59803 [Rubroshorea leprosula]
MRRRNFETFFFFLINLCFSLSPSSLLPSQPTATFCFFLRSPSPPSSYRFHHRHSRQPPPSLTTAGNHLPSSNPLATLSFSHHDQAPLPYPKSLRTITSLSSSGFLFFLLEQPTATPQERKSPSTFYLSLLFPLLSFSQLLPRTTVFLAELQTQNRIDPLKPSSSASTEPSTRIVPAL